MEELRSMEDRDMFLNLHFFRHYHSVLEQREDKEVYLANGFT